MDIYYTNGGHKYIFIKGTFTISVFILYNNLTLNYYTEITLNLN